MFLKKLIITGFKSFASHSEVTFVKGISAIVGPNGCGKSNIVDALKWVIGEQRTKMLRANSMTDVIFKGTEEQKGLGRAEVKLVLVNEQNILPIDFNEVEISRVIFANGENEYYINKKRVRLKDIQELFLDTGVGKSAYSVMEQGKIDLILSNKPEDRRYMIEEAAGISKYKVKREDAVNRLKHSNENIIRIKDIIEEVKSQYDHMKTQAKKAIKFKELYDKEIKLETELNLNRVIRHKNINNELHEKLNNAQKELEEVKNKLESLEDGVEDQMTNLSELENKKIEAQRSVFKLQSEIQVLESKKGIQKEQIHQHELNIRNDNDKIARSEKNILEVDTELENLEKDKKELDESEVNLINDVEFYKKNISKIENEILEIEKSIKTLRISLTKSNEELKNKRVEQKEATDQLILKIDQSLNITDVSAEEIMNFKKTLGENIAHILDNLPKKRAFIDDIVRGGYLSKESNKFLELLNTLKGELEDIEKKITVIDEDVRKYIQTTEVFLNDIFGPEGALLTKRTIENKINQLIDRIKDDSDEIEEKQQEIIKKREKKDEANKLLHELNINLSTMREKKKSIDNDVKRLISMKAHHETNKEELLQKIDFSNKKIESIKKELDDINIQIEALKDTKDISEKKLVTINKEIKDETAKMSSHQKSIKDINNKWMNKKSEVEKINLKIVEAETTISNIYDSFYENFSIDLQEFESKKEYSSKRNYDEIRKELGEIKSEKHSLGNVNLMAIEESKALEERYNLLTEQLEDLELAKNDIVEMIEKINAVSEEMFEKTFNEIKVNFHKIFRKLFDGGNAEILLTKPDNMLETGIDIIAHPPGQKTQTITLLSGGQRTMTAIALMFATFLVKPSPFCLLDEIDAALDEENVTRFINLLFEFKEKSQFIMITHNKKTISAADVMYGVTQEQKGISKIVSAKFAESNS